MFYSVEKYISPKCVLGGQVNKKKNVGCWKITMPFLLTKCFLIFAIASMQMNKRVVICCI